MRSIALISLLLAACTPDAPAQAPPALEASPATPPASRPSTRLAPGDPHAAPAPGKDEALIPPAPSAKGTFDVTVSGEVIHLVQLSPSQNRAVSLPEDGVTRVTLGAAEREDGGRSLRLLLEWVRPDQVEYPLTISATSKPAAGPTVSLRYEVSEKRVYVINPDKGAEVSVTLEGYEGQTLRGRFEGKLAPTAAGLGEPIPVSGAFAVELGLRGVEPGQP